jgi:hypothetical protein
MSKYIKCKQTNSLFCDCYFHNGLYFRVYIGSVILLLVILLAIVSTILVLKFHHSSSKDDDHKAPKDDPTVWVFPTPTSPKHELKVNTIISP